MSEVHWYKQVHVQKGRKLSSPEQVVKRLKEIRDNPKSAYHKRLLNGEISVCRHDDRQTAGQYDIIYLVPTEPPIGNTVCGECFKEYFSLADDDYLCPSCRELTET